MVSFPKCYSRIDFVADCYFEDSIKAFERLKPGISTKVLLNLVSLKFQETFLHHSYCVDKIKQDW